MEPASMLAHKLRRLAAQTDNSQEISEAIRALLQLDRDSRCVDDSANNVEPHRTQVPGRMRSL